LRSGNELGDAELRPWAVDGWALITLLGFWFSRVWRLDALPLHIDEGIHLRAALIFWEGNPLWRPENGKTIGHWAIALLWPQNAPVYAARMATVLLVIVGVAAGYALVRRLFGRRAGLYAALLWTVSPYLFFFERTALVDAQTGALSVIAVWAAVELIHRDRLWLGVGTGLAVLVAILYKLTALPLLGTVGIVILFYGRRSLVRRVRYLLVIGGTLVVFVGVPGLFVLPRLLDGVGGGGMLGTVTTGGTLSTVSANLMAFVQAVGGVGTPLWAGLVVVGLVVLLALRPRDGWLMILAPLPMLLSLVVFSSNVFYRYFAVVMPLWTAFGGAGLGLLIRRYNTPIARRAATSVVIILMAVVLIPFAWCNYADVGAARLPTRMSYEYVTEFSAGFGLREAVIALPETVQEPDMPIVGGIVADSCRRANYYALPGYVLTCSDELGGPEIEAALAERGLAYVLTDRPPSTGIDPTTFGLAASQVAVYPRPGDAPDTPSVTLWLVRR